MKVDREPHKIGNENLENFIDVYKEDIELQLIRLDASLPGIKEFSPLERIQILRDSPHTSISELARRNNAARSSINVAIWDAAAATFYVAGENDCDLVEPVKRRICKLENLNNKLKSAHEQLQVPVMQNMLTKLPHVRDLVEAQLYYNTAAPVLDSVDLPYNKHQLRSVRKYVFEDKVTDSLEGITPLSKRYALAKWLTEGKTYFGHGDSMVAKAAIFIYGLNTTTLPGKDSRHIGAMKVFLSEMLSREYEFFEGKLGIPDDLASFFVDLHNRPVKSKDQLHAANCYRAYFYNGYCPFSLKIFASNYINEVNMEQRNKDIYPNQMYCNSWKSGISRAGIDFLEKAVIWCKPEKSEVSNFRIKDFVFSTGKLLKNTKQNLLDNIPKKATSQLG